MAWDDIKIAKLKALWAEGLSCSQIAARFGSEFSRNAIIGKVHRLKLQEQFPRAEGFRNSPTHRQRRTHARKRRSAKATATGRAWNGMPAKRPNREALVSDLDALRLAQPHDGDKARKRLHELEECDCRWPVGDPKSPEFGYCGLQRLKSAWLPYCLDHYLRSTQPLPKKQRADTSAETPARKPISETV